MMLTKTNNVLVPNYLIENTDRQ